jgi:hypothetical protein
LGELPLPVVSGDDLAERIHKAIDDNEWAGWCTFLLLRLAITIGLLRNRPDLLIGSRRIAQIVV